MAELQSSSRPNTPTISIPLKRAAEEDHAPAVSSPLNPDPNVRPRSTKPLPREQRERRETAKKREARGNTPSIKTKAKAPTAPSPWRYAIQPPRPADFAPPKDPIFVSHEPDPIFTPDGLRELRKTLDHAKTAKGFRYSFCVADPMFRHNQWYRPSDCKPYTPRISFEDSDKWMHFDDTGSIITVEKGWRMGRGNVCVREGSMYFEVMMLRGVPPEGPPIPPGQELYPQPHIRVGWARREAVLDAPVGFDGFSYGITDIRFETMHRSRSGKIYNPLPPEKIKPGSKSKKPQVEYVEGEHIRTGDVLGLSITLPSLALHKKVVEGTFNPAVDLTDGFDEPPVPAIDLIRDRNPVPYKGNMYFEQSDPQVGDTMALYNDRSPVPPTTLTPSPNHRDTQVRSLPFSKIEVWKNGKKVGTAFENLLAFLPPASKAVRVTGSGPQAGFDDGMFGYFPAVAAFSGGVAQVNFGPDFWYPPPELMEQGTGDTEMNGMGPEATVEARAREARRLRPVGDRWKEQIAEDIVWDMVDEADFFEQDGGYGYVDDLLLPAGKRP